MSEMSQSKGRRSSILIGAVLVLSLAANTFFLGTWVGGRAHSGGWGEAMHGGMGPDGGPGSGADGPGGHFPFPREFDPRFLAHILPDEAQAEATLVLEAREDEIRALLDEAGEARFQAFSHMRGEAFDGEAMAQALETSRLADARLAEVVHSTMIEIMAGLTPEQRAAFDERMDERFHDRRERRDRFRRRHEGRRDRR